jgi:hypothetical protein
VPLPSQESEQSCICVSGIDFASYYDFFIGFWKCSDSVVFFLFPFLYDLKLVEQFFVGNLLTRSF